MEDIFKTESIYDKMIHTECVRFFPCAHRGRALAGIILEAALLFALTHFEQRQFILAFLLWSAVYLICDFVVTRKQLKNAGEAWHITVHIREDGILVAKHTTKNEVAVGYDEIRRIIETPKLFLLMTREGKAILLQKCWLTGGTPEALAAWLISKCPGVKQTQGVRFGYWLRRIVKATTILGSIVGLIFLWQMPGKAGSQTTREIAQELAELDITISEDTFAYHEAFEAEYAEYLPDGGRSDTERTVELLCFEGMGTYDPETLEWTPSDSGIYWFDTEVVFVDSIYTNFFAGLAAMDAELEFSNVCEDYSGLDLEPGTGTLPVNFDHKGRHYELEAQYNYDWFDLNILVEVSRIVSDGENRLYYAFDGGQGILVYYGTAADVRILERMTALSFTQGTIPPLFFS